MECAPCERRERGRWGESLVDHFMNAQGWSCFLRNVYFRGGEIDRVYIERHSPTPGRVRPLGGLAIFRRFCLAEVKVASVLSSQELPEILSESGMRRFLKPQQMRNLAKVGTSLLSGRARASPLDEIHLRLFLALRFRAHDGQGLPAEILSPARVCVSRPDVLLLSFVPDLCQGSSSGLQVRL